MPSTPAPGTAATDGAPAGKTTEAAPSGVPQSPPRAVPDYDGRGEPPATAGSVALWVPRVLFAPFYFVSEFLIRRPLGWFISTAERNGWPDAIVDFFYFGDDKKAAVFPTAFLDLGFRASVGIYAFWDDLLGKGNHLRLHATTFGKDWFTGALADKIPVGSDAWLDLRAEMIHRPDQIFHGLGPRTRQDARTRYGIDQYQFRTVFEASWWRSSRIDIEAGIKRVRFRDDACCDDPSLSSRIDRGLAEAPPAYDTGYTSVFQRAELTVDSRPERPASQTGVRLEVGIEQAADLQRTSGAWLRYGASLGGYLDVKNNRTLSLSVTTLFADPLQDGRAVPFTEQVVLGGSGPMRGYLYGRLIDRSAAIMTLKYRWPVWIVLDGTIQIATGNVFGAHLEEFKPGLLRLSGAIGVETTGRPDHTFEVLVGAATETFDAGATINSFRLLFGTNRGF